MTAVVDDMSITIIPGRVTDSSVAIAQAQEAERLGFERAWLPERYNIKEAGVLMGAMAASTSRIGVGTGPLSISARPPIVTASLAMTMQSVFGERFVLGVGRSNAAWLAGHGFTKVSFQGLIDHADIIKRLMRGEVVTYDGAAGRYDGAHMIDLPEEAPPPIVYFHLGGPKASEAAAHPVWDQIAFCNLMSAESMAISIRQTREAVERQGRDPDALHFIAPVTSAPEFDEEGVLTMCAARIVIGLQLPEMGKRLAEANGWDAKTMNEIRNHPQFAGMSKALIDHSFHRNGLLEPAKMVPEHWLRHCCVVGSIDECVARLRDYKDAGIDEIDLYGSTPADNAKLLAAWREHTAEEA
jgi:probable F420-dependent oxidoreductase